MRLKELELKLQDQRKKDSQEIESLIKKSMEDLRKDEIAERIAPPSRQTDISSVFSREEMEANRPKPSKNEEDSPALSYLRKEQLVKDYAEVKDLLNYELSPGSLGRDQIRKLEDINTRLTKSSYATLSHSDQMAVIVSATKEALYRVRKYTGIE